MAPDNMSSCRPQFRMTLFAQLAWSALRPQFRSRHAPNACGSRPNAEVTRMRCRGRRPCSSLVAFITLVAWDGDRCEAQIALPENTFSSGSGQDARRSNASMNRTGNVPFDIVGHRNALLCYLVLPIVTLGSRATVRELFPQVRGGRRRSSAARANCRIRNGLHRPVA